MKRFGIKAQIMLLSMGLLALPWLGISYWQEVKETTLATQLHIQTVEAKAIATSLLATQDNIAELLSGNENSERFKYSLSAPLISQLPILDGRLEDWPENNESPPLPSHLNWQKEPETKLESTFQLKLAQTERHLYFAIEITDQLISYRRNHLRLDYNDHIRLSYRSHDDTLRRVIIPAEQNGVLPAYFSNQDWEYGIDPSADLKSHQTPLQGYWRRTKTGYIAELRLPLTQLNTNGAEMLIEVVDVDDAPSLGPKAILSTLPTHLKGQLNPVEVRAQRLQLIIDQLKTSYASLGIYDVSGREWAFASRDKHGLALSRRFNQHCGQSVSVPHIPLIDTTPDQMRNLNDKEHISVCYPIKEADKLIGFVVIDERTDHVLEQHKQRLNRIALKTGLTLSAVVCLIFIYAIVLARRISRLSIATRDAIDSHGRIITTTEGTSQQIPDEVSDLSNSITILLEQQQSYVQFLEQIPQTLRHEISNPLNNLRTSLENLVEAEPEISDSQYIQKLHNGVDQITSITQQLTEAASLESALQNENLQTLDLKIFLQDYASNWDGLTLSLCEENVLIKAESARLEQLLDKLLDNAFSFCEEGGEVKLSLKRTRFEALINVENDGSTIPENKLSELFLPMTSTRSEGNAIHLGLGLHIVRIIAEHHHARASCYNRTDNSGVIFSVAFNTI